VGQTRRRWFLSKQVVSAAVGAGAMVAVLAVLATSGAAAGTPPCTVAPNPSSNGYWTPFGDGTWTGLGLLTSSQASPSQPTGVTCGGASVYGSALPTTDPNRITALSFDFNANLSGPSGDSPRLVVCFSDGADCNSNGNFTPRTWSAGVWTHVDGFAPNANDVWANSGGTCGGNLKPDFAAIVACHPGASITQVVVVNDSGSLYASGEQVLLNNMTVNNVVAHEVPPVLGQSAEIDPVSGSVSIKQPGSSGYVPVKTIMALRYGATLHATGGNVQVIAAKPGSGFESGQFYDGGFNLSQGKGGVVQATLNGRLKCPTTPLTLARDASSSSFRLWGHVKGKFRTRGHYGSASVQGTIWLTRESCAGTFFHVVEGVLKIRDFTLHKTVIIHAGHSYLAVSQPADTFDHDGDFFNDRKFRHG